MESPVASSIAERMEAAWQRHPLHAFLAHRRRLALLRQLAGYLRAGVGLPVAIAEMARFAEGGRARRRIDEVAREIDRGGGLERALRGAGLDELSVEILATAEETGSFDRMLPDEVARLEAAQATRWRFVVGLIHPAWLAALLVFISPLFSLGEALRRGWTLGDLPRLYAVAAARNLLTAAALAIAVAALPLLPALFGLEARWDRLRMRMPLVGPLFRQLYGSRLLSVLATARAAGSNAPRAVELAVRATASPHLTPLAASFASTLHDGRSLAEALAPLGILDGTTLAALAMAERCGELDSVPARLATELAQSSARHLRMLLAIAVAVALALLVIKVVIATVASFVGTLRGFDEDMDKLMKQQ